MTVDHLGYAVKNIDKAREAFETLGFEFEKTITDEERGIYILFGNNGSNRIELVAPIKGCENPVDGILSKSGPTPYHYCYLSDNLEKDIEELSKKKFRLILPPKEACAFNGRKVAFLYSISIGIVEIVEK